MSRRVVVVGASIGGVRTVAGLRDAGFTGEIVLVGPEAATPYDRPPLSKQILQGAWSPARAWMGQLAAQWDATVVEDTAIGLNPATRQVELRSGARVDYDTLVIATGATPRTLPGHHLEGVHVLRTMADCLALRTSLARGGPLVVLGGGFIGAEVASSAVALGVPVSLIEALPVPMARILGDEVGRWLAELHEQRGVDLRCGTRIEALEGNSRVRAVQLSDGTDLPADTVAVGVGVVPNTEWLASSGIEIDNGIVCDEYCAVAAFDDVYAVGDVARCYDRHTRHHSRIEHWTNAIEQANTVAHNIACPQDRWPYQAQPYFWSDQHGMKIQLVGHPDAADSVRLVHQENKTRVAALYHTDDRLDAAVTINWPRALVTVRPALQATTPASELAAKLEVGATGARGSTH